MKKLKNILLTLFAIFCVNQISLAKLPKIDKDENPLILMFAINGKPENAHFGEALKGFRNAGITQFLIYPRTGCEFNYMQEDWRSVVKYMIDEAKRLNFTSVWLYDEFNWPSGTANKEVMRLNPEHSLHQLSALKDENGDIKFEIVKNSNMPNLLDPEAVDSFINLTHEKYYDFLKDDFGGIIKGIFTDEPALSYFVKDKKYLKTIPYYKCLEEDYKKLTGGDLREDIVRGLRTNSEPFRVPLTKLLGERFRKTYFDKITDWTTKHGIYSTGHLLNESFSQISHPSSGHILDALCGLSFPAIDEIRTHETIAEFEWLTYSCGRYAIEKTGFNGGMAELFALGPCDMSLARVRRHIWLSAAFGINRYLLAITQSDLRTKVTNDPHHGENFTRWLSSFSVNQPWFERMSVLGEDAKKAAHFALKEPDVQVSVVYPYDTRDITHILKILVENQISWKITKEGDAFKTPYTIMFYERGVRISGLTSDSYRASFDAFRAVQVLKEKLSSRLVVLNKAGELARDIFAQPYKDGSALIVNFTKQKRDLFLVRDGKKEPMTIQSEGVIALEKNAPVPFEVGEVNSLNVDWKVLLDKKNAFRVPFKKSSKYDFELEDDMEVTFSIRNLGRVPEFEIDGKLIVANNPSVEIPIGFAPIFKQKSVKLGAGKHTIKLRNQVIDYAYMPLLIISGNFSKTGDVFEAYKNDGRGLSGYVGKIAQSASVEIPADAKALAFDTKGLCAELFVNGKSFGAKMWGAFEWEIPVQLRGKSVDVKLIRYTTLGRIFGDIAHHDWLMGYKIYAPKNSEPIEPIAPMFIRR